MELRAPFSRILVPIDFSQGSEAAWRLAQSMAAAPGAELLLLHVLPATPLDVDLWLDKAERNAARRAVEADHQLAILRADELEDDEPQPGRVFDGPLAATTLGTFSPAGREWAALLEQWADVGRGRGCRVRTELRVGQPHREVLSAIFEHAADLVVMATHGHGQMHRLFVGSVADRVIRMAPCPVLTVKAA